MSDPETDLRELLKPFRKAMGNLKGGPAYAARTLEWLETVEPEDRSDSLRAAWFIFAHPAWAADLVELTGDRAQLLQFLQHYVANIGSGEGGALQRRRFKAKAKSLERRLDKIDAEIGRLQDQVRSGEQLMLERWPDLVQIYGAPSILEPLPIPARDARWPKPPAADPLAAFDQVRELVEARCKALESGVGDEQPPSMAGIDPLRVRHWSQILGQGCAAEFARLEAIRGGPPDGDKYIERLAEWLAAIEPNTRLIALRASQLKRDLAIMSNRLVQMRNERAKVQSEGLGHLPEHILKELTAEADARLSPISTMESTVAMLEESVAALNPIIFEPYGRPPIYEAPPPMPRPFRLPAE